MYVRTNFGYFRAYVLSTKSQHEDTLAIQSLVVSEQELTGSTYESSATVKQ